MASVENLNLNCPISAVFHLLIRYYRIICVYFVGRCTRFVIFIGFQIYCLHAWWGLFFKNIASLSVVSYYGIIFYLWDIFGRLVTQFDYILLMLSCLHFRFNVFSICIHILTLVIYYDCVVVKFLLDSMCFAEYSVI